MWCPVDLPEVDGVRRGGVQARTGGRLTTECVTADDEQHRSRRHCDHRRPQPPWRGRVG